MSPVGVRIGGPFKQPHTSKNWLRVKTKKKRSGPDLSLFKETDHRFSINFALFIKLNRIHPVDRFGIRLLDLETYEGNILELLPVILSQLSLDCDKFLNTFKLCNAYRCLDVAHPEVVTQLGVVKSLRWFEAQIAIRSSPLCNCWIITKNHPPFASRN